MSLNISLPNKSPHCNPCISAGGGDCATCEPVNQPQQEWIVSENTLLNLVASNSLKQRDRISQGIRSRPHTSTPARMEGVIPCPICGSGTWYQLADGKPTLFCYSASCRWKQTIEKSHDTALRNAATLAEREISISKITTILGFNDPDEVYQKLDEWRKSLRSTSTQEHP